MAEAATDIVRHLRGLALGGLIEAWHEGRCYNRGTVTQAIPSKGCSGFLDSGGGRRKFADLEALRASRELVYAADLGGSAP